MVKYDVKILITDRYQKKGAKDITYSSTLGLDELRALLYHLYFRNPALREKFDSAEISSGGKRVGNVFVSRLGFGNESLTHFEGKLHYLFVGPDFIRNPFHATQYVLDKKTGKVIGTVGWEDVYDRIPGALGTGMDIRLGARSFVKRL